MNRTRKTIYNASVMLLHEVVTVVCSLILPRLLLVGFGSDVNGLITSITKFLGFISILRLGLAGSTRVALYKTLADGDTTKTSGIIVATERFMRRIAYVLIGYIAVLAIAFPLVVDSSMGSIETAALVIIIGIGFFAEYFFGITYQTLLIADQRGYVYSSIQIVVTIINTFLGVVLIKTGFSIFAVKLGNSLLFMITPIILALYVRKRYNIDRSVPPDESALKNRKAVMTLSVANLIHENVDITVLTIFTSTLVCSVYTIYNLVISALQRTMSVFTYSLEAAFGNMFAKKEYDTIETNLNYLEYFMGFFVSVVFSCAVVLILPFVSIYTSGVTDVEYIQPAFAYLSLAALALICFREPYLICVQAAGKYKETQGGAVVEAILNLGLSIVAVFRFGLVGVTVGTLAANLFRSTQYLLFVSKKLLERSIVKSYLKQAWAAVNIAISCSIYHLLPIQMEYSGWGTWIVAAFIIGAISVTVSLLTSLLFYKHDLKNMLMKGFAIREIWKQ